MPSSIVDYLDIGGDELLSLYGHLGSEEPIVKPALVRSYYFKEVTIND